MIEEPPSIPDPSVLDHEPKTKHELILAFARKHPDEELKVQLFEREFPKLTAKQISDHLSRLSKQGALTRLGYNRYRLNRAYQTLEEKQMTVREHVAQRPLKIITPTTALERNDQARERLAVLSAEGATIRSNLGRYMNALKGYAPEGLTAKEVAALTDLPENMTSAALSSMCKQGRLRREQLFPNDTTGARGFRYYYVTDKIVNHGIFRPNGQKQLIEAAAPEQPVVSEPVAIEPAPPKATSTRNRTISPSDSMFLRSIRARMKLTPALFTEDDLSYMDHLLTILGNVK